MVDSTQAVEFCRKGMSQPKPLTTRHEPPASGPAWPRPPKATTFSVVSRGDIVRIAQTHLICLSVASGEILCAVDDIPHNRFLSGSWAIEMTPSHVAFARIDGSGRVAHNGLILPTRL